jgi:hypothetical protein
VTKGRERTTRRIPPLESKGREETMKIIINISEIRIRILNNSS